MSKNGSQSSVLKVDGPAERVFVVGDIHGCLQEFAVLYRHLFDKVGFSESDRLIFVGDYIDRGPDSKGVVDLLIEIKNDFPETVFLKGNHEDMLLNFLGFDGQGGNFYLPNGGIETLQSYGIKTREELENIFETMPAEHLDFYQSLERLVFIDKYIVVHAGLNPLRDLDSQVNEDIFWIRDEFIQNVHYFEKTVVFGHTPYQNILFDLPYKVGLDTGLVFGNMLSCLELGSGQVFQVSNGETQVAESKVETALAEKFGFNWLSD